MGRRAKYGDERINVFDNDDLKKWCTTFNCERDALITAALSAGRSPKHVESFFRIKKKKR